MERRFIRGIVMNFSNDGIQVYLAGEVHGVIQNAEIKFQIFEYLLSNYGVKKLLVEMGYYDSLAISAYLETGKEDILKSVLGKYSTNYLNTEEEYNFWRRMYKLNNKLQEEQKIKVVGVDCNGQIDVLYRYILYLLKSQKESLILSEKVMEYKNTLKSGRIREAEVLSSELDCLLHNFIYSASQDEIVLKKLFKQMLAYGKRIMYPEKKRELREEFIYDSIKEELEKGEIMFGQFGYSHVISIYANILSAADRVVQDIDSACRKLVYVYKNCKYFIVRDGDKQYIDLNSKISLFNRDESCIEKKNDKWGIVEEAGIYYILIDNINHIFI